MNSSSGIKRGLAASAISALAIAGLPLLASSANAATGDSIAVASVGPVLNAGTLGGVVVLKTKGVDPTKLALKGSDLTSSQNTATQSASIVAGGTSIVANGADGDSNKTDGLDEITMHVSATTPTAGSAVVFAVYEDEDADNAVDAAEARSQVSMTTSGPLSNIDVTPASQSAAQNIESGAYDVTLQDAAGRTTQLMSTESVAVSGTGGFTPSDASFTASELELGTGSFTGHAATVGTKDISLTASAPAVVGHATLVVTTAATVTNDEVDIVTGADSWDGPGDGTDGGTTVVRVDQSSIRIDIDGNDDNSTVTLNVASANVTFGGEPSTTVSTVLDDNGVGSLVITPDAGTVQAGDSIAVTGSFDQTIQFARSAPTAIESPAVYFSAVKGSVDLTATVVDQFGDPVTTGYVEAFRSAGPNVETAKQRKAVGNDGTATFTFTDTKATNGQSDTVSFDYFPDQFANLSTLSDSTTIKYTTSGMGNDFKTRLDTVDTEGATYKASDVTVIPLADGVANSANEAADLTVETAENSSEITVSVDNGAKILKTAESELAEGVSSITATTSGTGTLSGYRIVGTKSGVVTVTVTSAHRTETAQLTVLGQDDQGTARNVTVSGPAQVESGATQIGYTAVVTDAFGNPIAGYQVNWLNVQVTGPAQFQDGDAMTNAAGQIHLNVRLDSDAQGDVSIRVQGLVGQMGAPADQEYVGDEANSAEGLPASSNIATATTTVAAAAPERAPIVALLKGTDNGAMADKVTVDAPSSAAGATVRLYKFVNGVRTFVKANTLGAAGNRSFKVADKNGNARTKYVAKVSRTSVTKADWTDNKRVR